MKNLIERKFGITEGDIQSFLGDMSPEKFSSENEIEKYFSEENLTDNFWPDNPDMELAEKVKEYCIWIFDHEKQFLLENPCPECGKVEIIEDNDDNDGVMAHCECCDSPWNRSNVEGCAIKGLREYQDEQIVPMVKAIAREGCVIVFDSSGNGAGDPGTIDTETIEEMLKSGDFDNFHLEDLDDDRRKQIFVLLGQPESDTTWYQIWSWVGDNTLMTAWIWRV
jgi:hypothetical protein